MNYLDLSNKIERLSDSKNSLNEMSNQNTETCATKGGFYFPKTGKCYVQSSFETKNWNEARADCKRNGGDLATIADQDTQAFFGNITRNDVARTWIGAEKISGIWFWADGTPWTEFGNWASGEPSAGGVNILIHENEYWYDARKLQYSCNYLCQY